MYSNMSIVIQTFHIHTTNPCPIIIIYIKVMETCNNGPKELNRYKKLRVFNSTRWANRAVLGEDYRWVSRPTSSLLSLATGDLIQSEKHCVVLQPRVTGTHALCNLNGTPRLYYRPQFSLFAFTHIGWNGTKTNRVTELANEIFTQEFVRFYVVFWFSFPVCTTNTNLLAVLRQKCNKRPSIEENSEERNLVTIVNTAYQIYQPVHFNRVHGLTPLVANQHEIDSGSTFSQVDLCISFFPNSCLRQ